MRKLSLILLIISISAVSCTVEQTTKTPRIPVSLSDYSHSFVSIDHPKIALTHARIIDGTGSSIKSTQTILLEGDVIIKAGNSDEISIPEDFYTIDLSGKTVIPGIIGTHNHMRFPGGALLSTSPKLYLAAGVTTIQTCGTGNPLEEIAIAKSISKGDQPGPDIINSGPYFTGPDGRANFVRFIDEKTVRDTIRYWADQGVKWFKVYRNTRPEDLKIIVDEAHKQGAKVTGHLCATTYVEAALAGIDAIEHGFIHSYDHSDGKEPNICSQNIDFRTLLDINSEEVNKVQRILIENGVALSSTLSIYETQAKVEADERDLLALTPSYQEDYYERKKRKKEAGSSWYFKEEWLRKSVEYELQFYRKGGLLVAGPDPGLHNIPGYGDQKNYELFIKGGFTPEEAIQVMTSNAAKLLEKENIGIIAEGKTANLVILNGDLENDPTVIRNVDIVFKSGIGYDPFKLIDVVNGNVGSQTDDLMTYFGQKEPDEKRELFAPNIISKPDRHEFGCTFSKDGREFFFGVDNNGIMEIHHSKLENGVWSPQEKLFQEDSFNHNDPMFSPDENKLFFISNRPLEPEGQKKDIDIWYIERQGDSWSKPINLGTTINSPLNEFYTSFTETGRIYFASKDTTVDAPRYAYDIYYSDLEHGKYVTPTKLPEEINTNRYEADVFVAPDESYLIFCSIRRDGLGQGDLYISFKDEKGNWMPAVNMGDSINSDKHELCPFVSRDGKYLFYTSDQDIYWVSTKVLDNYRDQ